MRIRQARWTTGLRLQCWNGGLHRLQMAQDIGAEHLVERLTEIVGVDIGYARIEVEYSDAVDEGVEAPEGVDVA